MLHPPPFPTSVDQLDRDFLSTALGEDVRAYTTHRIGADRGMLGEIHVVALDTAAGPRSIIAKFAAPRAEALETARRGRTNERELRFYDELLPSTPVSAPACHGTWYDPETARFCLLQDVVETDPTVDQVEGLARDQVRLVIAELAALHARWWGDPDIAARDWLPRLDGSGRIANLHRLAAAGWEPMCAIVGDALSEGERRLGEHFPDRLVEQLSIIAALPSTLIHSDLRADNLLFSPAGDRVSIIDWQGCGVGPPAFDLAYLLSSSLTVDDRREHEDALLDAYATDLAAAGLALTSEEVRAGYAASMHYGLVIACALPLISEPGEPRVAALAAAVARRSIAALRDHDQLWEDV